MKANRYHTIKLLIDGNNITEFREIFDHIAETPVGKKLGFHFNTFRRRINNAGLLKVNDIVTLARLFGVNDEKIYKLIINQVNNKQKTGRKK